MRTESLSRGTWSRSERDASLQDLQGFPCGGGRGYLCGANGMNEMTLPPHIVDLVGSLLEEGWDDDRICDAVVQAWRKQKNTNLPSK